ncbi:MAG TPA: type IV pilin protein [Flavobacteriales bacterium]|nr:type IV pilin protein [Flavobacteriales bacterium]
MRIKLKKLRKSNILVTNGQTTCIKPRCSGTLKVKGLTLMEVLIVLVILGIIAMIALPNYSGNVSKAKATEAKLQLGHIHTLEKEYFYQYSKYTADVNELGYEQEKLSSEGGTANYTIEIVEAGAGNFKARATAAVDFDQDGQINVWEIDEQKKLTEVTKD